MNTFDERKKGFEAKFLKDQELQFKIRARRNKFIGQWAAKIVEPKNIEEYVKEVRVSDLEKPGDDDIIDKLLKDFENISANISKEEIIQKIQELEKNAIDEFINESDSN